MTHTRNSRKALGAAAPDLDQLTDKPTTRPKKGRKAASSDGADGWAANQRREGSVGLDIPGAFAPSPVNVEARAAEPEQSDELDEAQAEAHISIAMGARTDEEESESCPPEESTDDDDESDSCPEERIAETGQGPSAYPNIGRASRQARTSTPFEFGAAEPAFEETGLDPSTTQFHTPSRKARASNRRASYQLEGPRFFSPDVLDKHNNLYIGFYESGTEPEPEPEPENRSDETLKQTAKLKKKSEAQQRAEDLTYLNEIIKDRKRRRRLQEMLPDIIPNNKSLLTEMREALRESSDEELLLSEWEIESESVPVSPKAGPSGLTQKAKDSTSVAVSEPTEYAGPSYFAKGKWVSDEVHDQRVAYKAKATEKATSTPAEGRDEPPKAPKKKARPSIGITIDEIRPARATPKPLEKTGSPALKASVTALPAGGYFADKMRARTQLASPNKTATKTEHKRQNSTSSSSASESSESSSSSEDNSSSDYSNGSSKRAKKRRNAKKSDKYREKARKLKREVRRARRIKAQLIEPTPYHGQADYDELEIWDYEIDQWLEDSGYKGSKAVRYIKQFLKGKAARWYMDFVAPDPQEHTVDSIKMGLFSYFFPPDMKSKLRNEFKYAKQGKKRFIDYLQELKRLQRRIPDITDKQMCIKLWDSVHVYIKVKWVEAGMNAEEAELSALTESAERFEAAEAVKCQIRTREERYKGTQDSQRTPKSPEANHLRCYTSESEEYSADDLSASDAETDTSNSTDVESQGTDPDRTANKQPEIFSAAVQLDYDWIKESDMTQGAHIASQSAAKPQDMARTVLKPLVAETTINGHRACALIDTGSLGDFMSETIVDKLKLERVTLAKPIGLQMVVAGSRSSIYYTVTAEFAYQGIREARRFGVINLSDYDLILGMPFLYQYQVSLGANPPAILIGSRYPLTLPPSEQFQVADALEAEPKLQVEMDRGLSHTATREAKETPMVKDRIPDQGAHRQLKAKTARQSNEDPGSRRNQGDKSEKKPNAPNNAEKASLPTRSTHSILALAVLPVTDGQALATRPTHSMPAYTPTQAATTLDPTHSTQSNQPDKAPGSFTPHESHVPTGQSSLPTQNPPANGPQGKEETINYEEDYSMQDAGGGH